MSDVNNSPFMNLPIPIEGTTPGPDWATDVNNSLTIIDQHNHTPGSGVQITPSGFNINTALSFNNNPATALQASTYSVQTAFSVVGSVYVSGVDLYYNDLNGNTIQITQGGNVAGTPGSISGLTSPASASYVAPTFIFQSNSLTAGNIDVGSVILRNITASSKGLTLNPPAAMASNYSITLPALPASQKIMTLDSSGNISAPYAVDASTIIISSNTIEVGTITNSNIVDNTISGAKITDGTITAAKLGITEDFQVDSFTSNGTWTCPAGVHNVLVIGYGGGGGGGASGGVSTAGNGSTGGGGGGGAVPTFSYVPVTPASTYAVVIGAGGAGAGTPSAGVNGATGSTGVSTTFGSLLTFRGGLGGSGGTANVTTTATAGGAGGLQNTTGQLYTAGGNGSIINANGVGGSPSMYAAAGTGGTGNNQNRSAGGGGGAGYGAGANGANAPASAAAGTAGSAAAINTGAGGGGGSGPGSGAVPANGGAGGAGGSGGLFVIYPKYA